MAYTAEHLATLKDMVAKGVTSLEQNGEKIAFRSLDEMLRTIAVIEADLGVAKASLGMHRPMFSRG